MVGLKSDFLIIDPDDQLTIVKRILKDEIKENNFYTDKPKAIVNFINKCKDEGKRSLDIIINNENRFKQLIYSKYEKYIQQENKLDFGELILLTKGLCFFCRTHMYFRRQIVSMSISRGSRLTSLYIPWQPGSSRSAFAWLLARGQ
jgi:hypothetical protein